ncbi:Hypothetical protein PP7435_CHR4-1576 [Komagataella phaffii CBS 7435]|uniref:Uncharacterized protein n=1 Tax=Komagataella phaffii (strain ATCC 76273 / CBS 7435 / CECT 11047 / NRRL Y-11430 / Wegner 21-1) TaxID=981350 RepID=A0A1G4KQV8_KOMPC|nr:GQ67_04704T0 [Komagataella phaffii]AOA69476.1 GQ68_04676T0 [Komagataella phaffii GS115]CAH2451013.1 Hypothetical protein BQ9382_C4-3315 [Komagataella phaffii CBS 7435]SCV12391.1 Hypothetical protein PP7435_CHR4-1576 [Komagataella phaffii CBS 7435]
MKRQPTTAEPLITLNFTYFEKFILVLSLITVMDFKLSASSFTQSTYKKELSFGSRMFALLHGRGLKTLSVGSTAESDPSKVLETKYQLSERIELIQDDSPTLFL